MTTIVWIGADGGDWATGTDWSPAPGSSTGADAIVITQPGTYTITADAAESVASVLLDSPDATLLLDAPLTVSGAFTLDAGTVVFDGGLLSAGSVALNGGLVTGTTIDIESGRAITGTNGTVDAGPGGVILLTSGGSTVEIGAAVTAGEIAGLATYMIQPGGGATGNEIVSVSLPATDTWTNTAGGVWSVGSNWSSGSNAPAAADTAMITVPGIYTVTQSGTTTVSGLVLDDPNADLVVNGSLDARTLTLNTGTLDLNGDLVNTTVLDNGGTFDSISGTLENITWLGTMAIGPNYYTLDDILTITDGLTVRQSDGTAPGDLKVNAPIRILDSETLDNMSIDLSGWAGLGGPVNPTTTLTLGPNARIEATARSGTPTLDFHTVINNGTLEVANGSTLSVETGLGGSFLNTGSIVLDGPQSVLNVDGPSPAEVFSNLGQFTLNGGQINVAGTYVNTGQTLYVDANGQITPSGTDAGVGLSGTIIGGTVVNQTGASIELNTAAIVLSGVQWTGPLILSNSNVDIESGTTVTALGGGADTITILAGVLSIGEDLTGATTLNNLTIQIGSTLDSPFDQGVLAGGPGGLILGTDSRLTSTAGIAEIDGSFINRGTVEFSGSGGTFDGATLVNSGAFSIVSAASATSVQLGNPYSPYTYHTVLVDNQGSISVSGAGAALYLTAATVQNEGRITVSDGAQLGFDNVGTFTSTGTVFIADPTSSVAITGSFTAAELANVSGGGGTLLIGGSLGDHAVLDNTGNTLRIGTADAFATLVMSAEPGAGNFGTIFGGTILVDAGGVLDLSGTLSGVAIANDLVLNNGTLTVLNGLDVTSEGTGQSRVDLDATTVNLVQSQTLSNYAITAAGGTSFLSTGGTLTLGADTTIAAMASNGAALAIDGEFVDFAGAYYGPAIYPIGGYLVDSSLINLGTISATGSGNDIIINTRTLINSGTITAALGGTLDIESESLINTGVVGLADAASTLILGGSATASQLNAISGSGGSLVVNGTLYNTGNTIAAGTGDSFSSVVLGWTGPLYFDSVITGGAIRTDPGGTMAFNNVTLDNVQIQTPFSLDNRASVDIKNGLELAAPIGSSASVSISNGSTLGFLDTEALDDLTITVGQGSNSLTGTSLTLGAGVSLGFGSGDTAASMALTSGFLLNDGSIAVNGPNNELTIAAPTSLTNEGLIQVSNGGHLVIGSGGTFSFNNTGVIALAADGTVEFANPFALGTITFTPGMDEKLILDSPGPLTTASIQNFSTDDAIEFGNTQTIVAAFFISAGTIRAITSDGLTHDIAGVTLAAGTGTQLAVGIDPATGDAVIQIASGNTQTWTGSAGSNLMTTANWQGSPSPPPDRTDALDFTEGGGGLTGARTAQSLLFEGGTGWTLTGTLNAFGMATLGQDSGSSGNLTVGASGTLRSNGVTVGDAGLGNLAIQSGGTLITTGGTAVIANTDSAGGSSVNVTGAGSDWRVYGLLQVGNAGFGQLTISQGATVLAYGLDAGVTAQGVINLSGTGSELDLSGDATIADAGSATLSILNGATVVGTDLTVGAQGTSSGVLTLSDPGSLLDLSRTLFIGTANGTGDLTVGPGATIIAASVQQQGQIVLEGGLLDPNVINVMSGQSNGGYGAAGDPNGIIDNDGTLLAKGTTKPSQTVQTFLGTIVGQGIMQIDAGSTMELTGPVLSGAPAVDINNNGTPVAVPSAQTVTFEATSGALQLDDIGGFGGTIAAYDPGDLFVITGGLLSGLGVANGNTLTLSDNGGTDRITFASAISAGQFAIVNNDTIQVVQCFAAGTRLQTAQGPTAVETLRVGDRLLTIQDARSEPIHWIGRRAVNCAAHPRPEQVWPVRVRCGAFGPKQPVRDLCLSPDHAVFINDVLIPVKYLINGTSIAQIPCDTVTYYHVELTHHAVILAEGLPVESFLDTGSRTNFENGGGAIALFPNFTSLKWETEGCAPLVVTGPDLEAARRHVAARTRPAEPNTPCRLAPTQAISAT